jgi:hypothetical protein
MSHVIGIGQKVCGEAAVLGVAAELGLVADRLPGRQAVFAVSASRIKPGHADPVAFLDERNAGADPNHDAYRLVTRDKGRRRLQRPVAVGGMQICVTDAAGLSLDQDLAGPGRGDIPLLNAVTTAACILVAIVIPLQGSSSGEKSPRLENQAAAEPSPRTASIILINTAWASP